jgi:hypothetical protein
MVVSRGFPSSKTITFSLKPRWKWPLECLLLLYTELNHIALSVIFIRFFMEEYRFSVHSINEFDVCMKNFNPYPLAMQYLAQD